MARKSLRASGAAASRSSSKRPTPSEPAIDKETPVKRAKRQSTAKSTPKKSAHFTHEPSDDEMEDDESFGDQDSADYEESAAASASDDEVESDLEEDEDEEKPQRSRGRAKQPSIKGGTGSSTKAGAKGSSELWRPGVKTGLGPGTQVVIRKPKARDAGDTPYADETIHPNTMHFLGDLASNNDREWLKMHDPDYRTSQQDWNSFLEKLTEKIIEIDETIPELPVKDIVFRIYRDVRFSKNPTPYKTHFSAAWSRTGRKGPYAAYYVQIQPGGSLIAGGLWQPEPEALGLLRRDIDRRSQRLKQALCDPDIRKEFLAGVADDDGKVVKKFVAHNAESALKTKPKGFESDHKDIELLRLRSFTLSRKIKDEEVLGPQGLNRIARLVECLVPFVTYLNSVVMPDQSSDEDDGERGEEEEEEEEEE